MRLSYHYNGTFYTGKHKDSHYKDEMAVGPSYIYNRKNNPDSKVHGANMGPTWVLPAPWTLLSGYIGKTSSWWTDSQDQGLPQKPANAGLSDNTKGLVLYCDISITEISWLYTKPLNMFLQNWVIFKFLVARTSSSWFSEGIFSVTGVSNCVSVGLHKKWYWRGWCYIGSGKDHGPRDS